MSELTKIVVVTTAITGQIVIGRTGKTPGVFLEKRLAEPEVFQAVAQYMMHGAPDGSEKDFSFDGGKQWYRLSVVPIEAPAEE